MFFTDKRLGNTQLCYGYLPKDWAMRIPDDVRKNVVFLGRVIPEMPHYFAGTGFLVNVLASDPHRWHVYLVTAKHVQEQLALGDWVIRVNRKDGQLQDVRMPKDHKWWFHPKEPDTTDVAITQFPEIPDMDFATLSERPLLDEMEMRQAGVGAGDEVFMVGLFNRMKGRSRNQPIVRVGNLAMIPDPGELVPGVKIGMGKIVDAEVFLIEARSLGGLSGSPAFVRSTVESETIDVRYGPSEEKPCLVTGQFFLLGLVNGHWSIDPAEKNDPAIPVISRDKPEAVNLGIAVVVPAKKIRETLHHPELDAIRAAADSAYTASLGSTDMD